MDSLINAAARALSAGDLLGALKRVALRDDPAALAIRGITMARLGDFDRARSLLQRAGRGFARTEPMAAARCVVAQAEIAFACRELSWPLAKLQLARMTLAAHGDRVNAAHALQLEVRRLLLMGHLDEAERLFADIEPASLPAAHRAAYELVAAGMAMRRLRTGPARESLRRAEAAARAAGIPALRAEVESAASGLKEPAARLVEHGTSRYLLLEEVEQLLASAALVIDACRYRVRHGAVTVSLARRPILFVIARILAESWPEPATRAALIARAFRGKDADDSYRARLRVEIGRLRAELGPVAEVTATKQGFTLRPRTPSSVVVLAPPFDDEHGAVLACLADGELWSSSALALALGATQRSIQRALGALASAGRIEAVGHGRSRRWMAPALPGFTTTLLLPAPLPDH